MTSTTAVGDRLRQRIRQQGPLPVQTWMADAVAAYYADRDPFGAAGDFVTAPEVSQMFGEMLGLWAAVAWQEGGAPDPLVLAEMGPGRGTLMQDFWRAAGQVPAFRAACGAPHLVETSPVLRARQAETLAALDPPPRWHETVATLPPGPLLLLGNELLDALPVRQWLRTDIGWQERAVTLDNHGAFAFTVTGPVGAPPTPAPPDAPPGTVVEECPAAHTLVATLAARVAHTGGLVLFIDYGPGGPGETLQAVRGHAPVPVLSEPGTADLTAHVDFAALARTAQAHGAQVWGPVPQGRFLRTLGIEARAATLVRAHPQRQREVETALGRLIDRREMGTLFQVLAFGAPRPAPPPGLPPHASTAG